MPSVLVYKAQKIVAVLLVLTAVLAAVGCLFDDVSLDHEYGSSTKPQHASSTLIGLGLHCLMVILPTIVFVVFLQLSILYASPLVLHHISLTSSPFIPPENAVH